ncbi:DUF4265 domain-containing protein [Streptomyces griseus]|uniref:DUF4265 domain-containing protein n=1 Tax=Streptomyces griseus TaxID=1911 RepID=UPI0008404AAB|nr:DUF4265 domain-containing protein [Streptomyces griseus]
MEPQKYIVHDDPAIMSTDQYITMVDLAPFGFAQHMEQIWLGVNEDGTYEVLCIPFRVYGMSLHDVVELDGDDVVARIVRSGRHRTMRGLIAPAVSAEGISEIFASVNQLVETSGFLCEWSGHRHVAIDIPPGSDSQVIQKFFASQREAERVYWEWSDARPFTR